MSGVALIAAPVKVEDRVAETPRAASAAATQVLRTARKVFL
jgi:hypothetical protein